MNPGGVGERIHPCVEWASPEDSELSEVKGVDEEDDDTKTGKKITGRQVRNRTPTVQMQRSCRVCELGWKYSEGGDCRQTSVLIPLSSTARIYRPQ